MKKIVAIFLLISMSTIILTGCIQAPPAQADEIKISEMDSKYGLTQMCKDLLDEGYLPESGIIMASEVIGAEVGYRFNATVNEDTIVIELYEFAENPNDVAEKTINDIKETGYFNVLDYEDVPAQLSDNEKYVVIYNDDKAKGENADKEHKEQYESFMNIFNKAK